MADKQSAQTLAQGASNSDAQWQLIAVIIEMIVKFGPMALLNIADAISTWKNKQEPTMEEIVRLRGRVPRPETYFQDGANG